MAVGANTLEELFEELFKSNPNEERCPKDIGTVQRQAVNT